MRDANLKNFVMTHQHTSKKAKIISPKKRGILETRRTPLHVLQYPRVLRNPCWRALD